MPLSHTTFSALTPLAGPLFIRVGVGKARMRGRDSNPQSSGYEPDVLAVTPPGIRAVLAVQQPVKALVGPPVRNCRCGQSTNPRQRSCGLNETVPPVPSPCICRRHRYCQKLNGGWRHTRAYVYSSRDAQLLGYTASTRSGSRLPLLSLRRHLAHPIGLSDGLRHLCYPPWAVQKRAPPGDAGRGRKPLT